MRAATVFTTSSSRQTAAVLPSTKSGPGVWKRSCNRALVLCRALIDRREVQPRSRLSLPTTTQTGHTHDAWRASEADTITFTIRVDAVGLLPKSAKLVWAGSPKALGEWSVSEGVEVRIDGDVGEAKIALPVGHHFCKLALVHADSTVQWEEGELRCLHVPVAALKVNHVAGLEATCVWNDTRATSMKTRVAKVRLTGDLAAVTEHIRGIKAQQKDLSARLSELESHVASSDDNVEQTTRVSVDVLERTHSLSTEHPRDSAARGPPRVVPQAHRTAADPLKSAANAVAALLPKAMPADSVAGGVVSALQRACRGAQVIAAELHPRFRGKPTPAASEGRRAKRDAAAPLPAASRPAASVGVQTKQSKAPNAALAPSPALASGKKDGESASMKVAQLSREQRKAYVRKELVDLSRKSSFPALALGWVFSASAKALARAAGAASVSKQPVFATAG